MKRFVIAALLVSFATIGAARAASLSEADIGNWIYNASGAPIGSLRALEGGEAVIMLGNYTWPGSHEVRVSAAVLSDAGGRLTISGNSELALRRLPDYRG